MSVFDGHLYRVRARLAEGLEDTYYVETPVQVEEMVTHIRSWGAKAVDVSRLFYAAFDDDTGLSYGDFYGDEDEEEDE